MDTSAMPAAAEAFSSGGGEAMLAGGVMLVIALIIGLLSLVLSIIVWWKIFSKAGYSGALSLLMLVPIVGLIVVLYLAFATWPIQRELEQLRRGQGMPRQM
jgi:uncharacterized membrane protein YhaH (DUF805 family)